MIGILMFSLRFFSRVGQIAIISLVIAACSPTGDFGRVSQMPKTVFDSFPNPADPNNYALVQSDEETKMQNLMQRFVSIIEGESWIYNIRLGARILAGAVPNQTDYFLWLKSRPYASSAGRYGALSNDVQLDVMTLPAVFDAICQVQKTDARRITAAQNLSDTSEQALQAIGVRNQKNRETVAIFVSRVQFRYDSYSYALENLLLESPNELAREVDNRLNFLAAHVQTASSSQFCAA
ncbi:MAG: hypothetical protein L3J21_00805 [Devosiaceae bacterium]|nr:hypothetical protein [Devosiaceae bacterium]